MQRQHLLQAATPRRVLGLLEGEVQAGGVEEAHQVRDRGVASAGRAAGLGQLLG